MLLTLLLVPLLVCAIVAADHNGSTPVQLNITVSVNGDHGYRCHTHYNCKTLEYVFAQIANSNLTGNASNIFIHVTYNQTITASRQFNFSQQLNITVSGWPIIPQIHIHPHKLQIKGGYYWRWESVEVLNCYIQQEYNGYQSMQPVDIIFLDFKSLTILDCTITVSYINIENVSYALFENNEFGNNDGNCPLVEASSAHDSHEKAVHVYNFVFIHNTISHCTVKQFQTILLLSYHDDASVVISSNDFDHIRSTKNVLFESGITITGPGFVYVELSNNSFTQNQLSFIHMDVWHLTTKLAQCIITGNQVDNNFISQNLRSQEFVNIFFIQYSLHLTIRLEITFSDNHICNNTKLCIGYVSAQGDSLTTEMYVLINEKNIRNNTAKIGLIRIIKASPARYGTMLVDIKEFTAENNLVNTIEVEEYSGLSILSILYVESVHIANATFRNNLGTPLLLQSEQYLGNTKLNITGTLLFHKNIGLLGGACTFQNVDVHTSGPSRVIFDQNHAKLGGALYLVNSKLLNETCNLKVEFSGNTAITAGNTVFFATNPYKLNYLHCNYTLSKTELNSLPRKFTLLDNDKPHDLFPGQNIVMSVSIIDYFDFPVSCTATVNLLCDGSLYKCFDYQVKLNGPTVVVIAQPSNTNYTTVDTNLKLASPEGYNKTKVSLLFTCRNAKYTNLTIPLSIKKCPLGFGYNRTCNVCQCMDISDNFVCSQELGTACIEVGYWYGPGVTNNHTSWYFGKCSYPECASVINSITPCPSSMKTIGRSYKLQFNAKDLCYEGRGGILCRECAQGYFFTFTSTTCVPGPCTIWQPILIVVLSIMVYVFIAVLALFTVRLKLTVGSGFLYGPMLFLAVINSLSFESYSNFTTLGRAMSIITSIPLMNLEIFGYIPWCFVPSLGRLYNYTLRYIGPSVVLIVIVLVSRLAKRFPTLTHRWMGSPLKAICILTLLSFWSLVDTSVHIIMPISIIYLNGTSQHHIWVSSLQPNIKYFSMQHLAVAIPAILLQIVVIIPLLVLLMFSSLLSKRINLHRIKPFLDEFQSCYKDQYRWFSVVFLVVWIITVCLQIADFYPIVLQAIFTLVLTILIAIQPYQSKVLNITDSLLLLAINLLIAIMHSKNANNGITIILVHLLTIGPLLSLAVWFTCVCLYKCGVHTKLPNLSRFRRYRRKPTACSSAVHSDCMLSVSCNEREPLIGIVSTQ